MNASIRIASLSDAHSLLEWRNDSVVRQFSKSSEHINENEHIFWLKTRLPKCNKEPLFIFMLGDLAAGTARLDCVLEDEKSLEISILLDPQYQGQGNAKVLLDLVYNYAIEKLQAEVIIAYIHSENIRSVKLFESAGFKYSNKKGFFLKYQKQHRRA
jgi:RimJ/RimL family protein N-acetyltransferase